VDRGTIHTYRGKLREYRGGGTEGPRRLRKGLRKSYVSIEKIHGERKDWGGGGGGVKILSRERGKKKGEGIASYIQP